jgi:hypothetical protein
MHLKVDALTDLLDGEGRSSKQKVRQRAARYFQKQLSEQRINKRQLGAGAPVKADEDVEQAIALAIEEKATFHGRRSDSVLYLAGQHRVRVKDFKDIANDHLAARGSVVRIKSNTTLYNLAQPKKSNSVQGI